MRFVSPIALATLLAFTACSDDGSNTTTTAPATTTTTTPDPSTTLPTTTAPDPSSSTGDPTTTSGTTDASTTTGGPPTQACVAYPSENACDADDSCEWASVFQYTHSAQGCLADVIDFCVEKVAGAPSTWYRGDNGDVQVVQFEYLPTDMPDEWKQCDCDGPLACFCSFNAPECPERLQEFCGATTTKAACSGSVINGEFRCAWFRISPEGPSDDMCTAQAFKETCLAADMPSSNDCTKIQYPYPTCSQANNPVYWRIVDGVVEVTAVCGPVPPSPEWTLCDAVDTPDQPDECGCPCL